jgi:hypothetical protein
MMQEKDVFKTFELMRHVTHLNIRLPNPEPQRGAPLTLRVLARLNARLSAKLPILLPYLTRLGIGVDADVGSCLNVVIDVVKSRLGDKGVSRLIELDLFMPVDLTDRMVVNFFQRLEEERKFGLFISF